MDEPILTPGQKQEWIDTYDNLIDIISPCVYDDYRKIIKGSNNIDISCIIRETCCNVMMAQNGLTNFDCSLCWVNWFLTDHESMVNPTEEEIMLTFEGLEQLEIDKINAFGCYKLIYKAIEDKDKLILDLKIEEAIDYLE